MGAPLPNMNPADEASAEALLSSLRTIAAAERRKHATALNYWHSIRSDRQFPPIRDLDPLEISDAGPFSILLEITGGGEDAEIRHIGQAIHVGATAERVSEAPSQSLVSCIASRLRVVASSQTAHAFEDEFETADGKMRCWVTLLPFSASGTSVDFVYGLVSLDASPEDSEPMPESAEVTTDANLESVETWDTTEWEPSEVPLAPLDGESEPTPGREDDEDKAEQNTVLDLVTEAPNAELEEEPLQDLSGQASASEPGFSAAFVEDLRNVGFHGRTGAVKPQLPPASSPEHRKEAGVEIISSDGVSEAVEDSMATKASSEPLAEEQNDLPVTPEASLPSKLAKVRAKADEARMAKLRANVALYEGLSAAYDFALDAEDSPEEYLKLVEAQGLKIQLRSPMRPVAKLAFDGMCDGAMIAELEALLAWAFSEEIPRGMLVERIEAEGGIGPILSGQVRRD